MSDIETRCLDAFPEWLRSLNGDAVELASFLENTENSEGARLAAAGGLNYLFKSLDLIPDGIEDLGFIDDAFVLRAAAALAGQATSLTGRLAELAGQRGLISEFLAEDDERFDAFVKDLGKLTVRGRQVEAIVADTALAQELGRDVRSWAQSYQAPAFARDGKNLVKLRAFLRTKLPK